MRLFLAPADCRVDLLPCPISEAGWFCGKQERCSSWLCQIRPEPMTSRAATRRSSIRARGLPSGDGGLEHFLQPVARGLRCSLSQPRLIKDFKGETADNLGKGPGKQVRCSQQFTADHPLPREKNGADLTCQGFYGIDIFLDLVRHTASRLPEISRGRSRIGLRQAATNLVPNHLLISRKAAVALQGFAHPGLVPRP